MSHCKGKEGIFQQLIEGAGENKNRILKNLLAAKFASAKLLSFRIKKTARRKQ